MRSGAVSKPRTSAQATGARGSSSWQTPQARDYKGRNTGFQEMLPNQAENWPTPATRDYKGMVQNTMTVKNGRFIRTGKDGTEWGATLDGVATNWPTPQASEIKSNLLIRENHQNNLSAIAGNWTDPNSQNSPLAQETQPGNGSSNTTQSSPPQPVSTEHRCGVGCMRLNPLFVTWMMLGKSRIGWLR